MKTLCMTLSLLIAATAITASPALADTSFDPPKRVNIGAEYVFAPPGFDNNDNAQIVVHGQLPNTCYKTAPTVVRVEPASHRIFVSATAYSYSGCFCLQVLTPFTHTLDLGILAAGQYQLIEIDAQGRQIHRGTLPIATTKTPQPDEHLYAPVKSASIERTGSQIVLHLSGIFSSDCLELQQVMTLHRSSRIIEVLPLAGQKPGSECLQRGRPFEARVVLPAHEKGDHLIHIRSMNGSSINLVEDL